MHPEPRQESESRDTRVQQSSVAEGAGKGAAKDPQQPATSGYSPGCGTGCLFWLVISVLWQVIWYHQSWSQAFHHILGPLWTFGSEIAWPILFHILKLALVCGGVVLLVFLLTKAEKWLASRNSDPDLIAGYLNSFLPLKLFLKLPKLFTESRSMVEKSATGKTHWSNAPLTLLVTAAALFGLEALVALPPSKASAALTLYEGTIHQVHDREEKNRGLLLTSVPAQLVRGAKEEQKERLKHLFPRALGCSSRLGMLDWEEILHGTVTKADDLRRDIFYERAAGTSMLGFCLELMLGIRTGRDLIQALPPDSSERAMLQASIDEIEKSSVWDKFISDSFLLIITIPTAIGVWLGSSRRLNFLSAMAVSAILWTVLVVMQELVYVSTSFVVTLSESQLLAIVAQFATLQVWLLAIMPKPLGIAKSRCWLIGNGAFVLLQGAGLLAAFKLF